MQKYVTITLFPKAWLKSVSSLLWLLNIYCAVSEKPSCALSNPENEKEKQELAMLDDILAKAQHARDIQTKVPRQFTTLFSNTEWTIYIKD